MRAFVWLMVAAQFFVAATPAFTQDDAPDRVPKLELVSARVRPGAPVFLNAMITNPATAPIYVVRQSVEFPRASLTFVLARLGIAANMSFAEIAVEMKDASGTKVKEKAAAQKLEITITAKEPIRDGPLAELEFRLAADTKEQTLIVKQSAEALDDKGKKVASLTVTPTAEVVVSESIGSEPRPAIGCFFFTH
ncbi:MAG: hypothetical protein EXQ56_12780 [Acidobacteria bacterium]|nr:hypothetical protein [Acidobacteriota bacterium]